jgi:putative oxidoreductase
MPGEMADWGIVALRIGVATSFLLHGIEKHAYWHQKPGGGNSRFLLRMFRILSIAEPIGGLAILAGFMTRIAAIGTALVMIGAIRTRVVVWKSSWGEDDGWEIDGILLAASVALILLGPGNVSIDYLIHRA